MIVPLSETSLRLIEEICAEANINEENLILEALNLLEIVYRKQKQGSIVVFVDNETGIVSEVKAFGNKK